jgi:hypothetical protein
MLQSGMLHLICVASCILPVLHVSCCLFFACCISVARCPFCTLHADCGMLSVVQAARCLWHPVRFAIIAAHWDSRCILHLSCCASRGVLPACLPRAAAAAPTDDGALAHARGTWVGTYPITVVATSPMTAPPTTVGKRCRYVRMRSAWRCSTSTGTDPLPHPSAACSRVAAGQRQRRAIAAAFPPLWTAATGFHLYVCLQLRPRQVPSLHVLPMPGS